MRKSLSILSISVLLFTAGCQSSPEKFSPEQISALKSQGFENNMDGWMLGLSEKLLFAKEKSTLTPESKEAIKRIALSLTSVGLRHARMDGHTDNYGDNNYNQELSLKRANAVADTYAKEANIPRSNLTTQGLGSQYPISSNKTSVGRAENRRVSIVITAP
ncbi:OmpA family protein [Pectobacterium sp. B1J-3]|uniref:OmpA family protein n=1 Tax=Pectobacterium sp. B1J-3 TaxID=3385371 RepID=UPI003905DFD8